MDMGFATSTLLVDQAPSAGLKGGTGRFGRVLTMRTPVILSLLLSWLKASGGISTMLIAASPPNLRNDLRCIAPSTRTYSYLSAKAKDRMLPPEATAICWRPFTRYVIGEALHSWP